ncbi:MAG TPA: hypothetical protein VFV07_05730 [Rhizomicrobium sp.]|nr:hypothetical protein [Rhizomicrobium sp.]
MRALLALAMALAMTTTAEAALNIVSGPTKHMSCLAGVCTATGKKAQLNAGDLQTLLASGDVVVRTGGGAVTIGVLAPVTWASTSRLTLEAQMSVHFNAPVIAEGTSGVTISPNYGGGNTGTLGFVAPGSLTFWDLNSSLLIAGSTYTLVGDIATLAQDIQQKPKSLYALANNYDASADGTYQTAPIQTVPEGVFEGLGHVISNLAISPESGSQMVGLFAQIDNLETIRDIGLENVNITGLNYSQFWAVGALVGSNANSQGLGGTIINSYSTGSVVLGPGDQAYGGGLVGFNAGPLSGSYSTCSVSVQGLGESTRFVGGLVGFNGGDVSGSFATGMVSGEDAGGLVGWNRGTIADSYVTGQMKLRLGNGAGFVYQNDGAISNSHADVALTTASFLGGYYAGFAAINNLGATIDHSYALGSVKSTAREGNDTMAALVAYNNGAITDSWASGSVLATRTPATLGGLVGFDDDTGRIDSSFATGSVTAQANKSVVGGLIGHSEGTVSNSYALGAVSGTGSSLVGGFAGEFEAVSISTSYAAGLVSGRAKYTGGFIADSEDNHLSDDYWDIDTTGQRKSAGGIGLTDPQLKSALPPGFDPAIWGLDATINGGLPYLLALPPK